MEAWLPGYEHDTAEADAGAGLSVGRGADKAVLHTTESPRGSYAAVRNLWRGPANWGRGLPHFIQDGTRFVQLLPLTVNAYTLANPPGPPDTNRSGHVIQVERCGYAAQPMADDEYDALALWLADLIRAGVPLDLAQHPTFYGQGDGIVLATPASRARLSAAAYDAFGGFLGHQHVPQNDHWDPGKIDGDRIETLARAYLTPAPTPPEDDMPYTPEQLTDITRSAIVSEGPFIARDPFDGGFYVFCKASMDRRHLPSWDKVKSARVNLGIPFLRGDDPTASQDFNDADLFARNLDDGQTVVALPPAELAAVVQQIASAVADETAERLRD